jgi:C1A family cysteine protease
MSERRFTLQGAPPSPFTVRWRDAPERTGATLPDRADLSHWGGPIRDQGQEGSCTAFSGAGAVELLCAKYRGERVVLSPAFLFQVERTVAGYPGRDQGVSLECTQSALVQVGVCREADDPYVPADFLRRLTPQMLHDAAAHRVQRGYWAPTPEEVLGAIACGYPVQIGLVVYPSFEASDGIVPMPSPDEQPLGGHALLADSYDLEAGWLEGPNSWGTGWGRLGGRYRIPIAMLRERATFLDARVYVLGGGGGGGERAA